MPKKPNNDCQQLSKLHLSERTFFFLLVYFLHFGPIKFYTIQIKPTKHIYWWLHDMDSKTLWTLTFTLFTKLPFEINNFYLPSGYGNSYF